MTLAASESASIEHPAPGLLRRPARLISVGLLVILLGLLLSEYVAIVFWPATWNRVIGLDYAMYTEAAARWVQGGSFYQPYQLAGPYPVVQYEVMYPPTALFLFVPFTVLPAPLFWLIPTAVVAWCVVSYRPSLFGWTTIAACLLFPATPLLWLAGNPVIWPVAGLAAAPELGWPAIAVALKPQFAPLAILSLRRRSFWIAVGLVGLASLLLLPLWLDWLTVLRNASSWPLNTPAYWIVNVPLLAIPVVAWLTRTRDHISLPRLGARGLRGLRWRGAHPTRETPAL
jgi:hypothetical protein